MKYLVLLGDGMPDRPIASLGNKTPLEKATTPHMDFLATHGRLGLVHVIPTGLPPGSDVGHLSVLGYNPKRYYTGRAPIEAAAMGIELGPRDVAFRCNLVNIGQRNGVEIMEDFSAGHIRSKESHPLIRLLNKKLTGRGVLQYAPTGSKIEFHPGVSYRHLMIWRNGKDRMKLTPPHDITGRPIGGHLPRGNGADLLRQLISRSRDLLKESGTDANSVWFWGEGRATRLPPFPVKGGIISAVDIVRGLGRLMGLEVIKVPGATGYFDTNYENKAAYALRCLKRCDFVFVHVEATDEAGHMGDLGKKIMALEDFDRRLIGPLLRGLERGPSNLRPYRILLTSDHATPIKAKTHVPDPAVFAIYDSRNPPIHPRGFCEKDAKETGDVVKVGHHLMRQFLKGRVARGKVVPFRRDRTRPRQSES